MRYARSRSSALSSSLRGSTSGGSISSSDSGRSAPDRGGSLPPGIGRANLRADRPRMTAIVHTEVVESGSLRILADVRALGGDGFDERTPAPTRPGVVAAPRTHEQEDQEREQDGDQERRSAREPERERAEPKNEEENEGPDERLNPLVDARH